MKSSDPELIRELVRRCMSHEELNEEELKMLDDWVESGQLQGDLPELVLLVSRSVLKMIWGIYNRDKKGGGGTGNRFLGLKWKRFISFLLVLLLGHFNSIRGPVHYKPIPVIPVTAQIGIPIYFESLWTLSDGSRLVLDSTGHARPFDVILPDGSEVYLAYGSSLRYAETFGADRELCLNGQAYFKISPDSQKPFIVHCGNTTVQVLGTRFNVTAYADEPTSEITLIEGAVRVMHGDQDLVLKPFEQAVVKEDKMTLRAVENPAVSISWMEKDPSFVFDSADPVTVLRRLARWYQVGVSAPKNFKGVPVSGTFPMSDSLDRALAHINDVEKVKQIHVVRKKGMLVLTQRGRRPGK